MADRPAESIRIADVAETAGVSPASVHYHFGDLSGLVLAAVDRASSEMFDERERAISLLDDPVAKLERLIELGVPDEPTPALVIMYTAIQAIRADEAAVRAARVHVYKQVDLYAGVIKEGLARGQFEPQGSPHFIASSLVALEDAYDLYLVVGVAVDGSEGRSQLRQYAATALGTARRKAGGATE
jgi:AcrR family transcriptional regulator